MYMFENQLPGHFKGGKMFMLWGRVRLIDNIDYIFFSLKENMWPAYDRDFPTPSCPMNSTPLDLFSSIPALPMEGLEQDFLSLA